MTRKPRTFWSLPNTWLEWLCIATVIAALLVIMLLPDLDNGGDAIRQIRQQQRNERQQ